MRVLHSPLYGEVRAAEKKDLAGLQAFAVILVLKWMMDIITRFDRGECAGEYAPFAAIYIYLANQRGGGERVTQVALVMPGFSYGTALIEPIIDALRAEISARGFDSQYLRGPSGDEPDLRQHAAREIEALNAKVLKATVAR